ncbi:hypothetical protein M427DRAFT_58168 [Gonapodya prolifera JEL478]|uniref:Proteasome assembly chaperone 4 n=1 Tax=Gonapodya prolifera (strain JEL478) TaxID=1344416 RepID=A0A139AAT4_GONPJ|nr:hypothetical protein M427DRAFT_58168 [Gonapodya prolifera JEL478]|eukprot:KXS13916.1 hypothetical protein M427DRAFT_58168 [Gonapodya prolifera JEL478]
MSESTSSTPMNPPVPSTSAASNSSSPSIRTHQFADPLPLMDGLLYTLILELRGGFWVWSGTGRNMGATSVAVKTRFDSLPAATSILGASLDDPSQRLARKLAARYSLQAFVSLDLPQPGQGADDGTMDDIGVFAERKIVEHLKEVHGR